MRALLIATLAIAAGAASAQTAGDPPAGETPAAATAAPAITADAVAGTWRCTWQSGTVRPFSSKTFLAKLNTDGTVEQVPGFPKPAGPVFTDASGKSQPLTLTGGAWKIENGALVVTATEDTGGVQGAFSATVTSMPNAGFMRGGSGPTDELINCQRMAPRMA